MGAGEQPSRSPVGEPFKAYWYSGQAELTRFDLEQYRYGEVHPGHAVLIFVTEDFLPDKQVKYEGGQADGPPVSVLKLNSTRKFYTGVYPYSIMTSVFTPVEPENPRTLKVSTSVQEWCGHTYQQLNFRRGRYESTLHSYFQEEADRESTVDGALLEDEIWTLIRLDPESLPVGEIEIIPGLQHARLLHTETTARQAVAERTVRDDPVEGSLTVYTVRYADPARSLEIRFQTGFPHAIVGWEESHGGDGERRTRAVRTHSTRLDYWNRNSVSDSEYRRLLGL
jgi:hypothetical protein